MSHPQEVACSRSGCHTPSISGTFLGWVARSWDWCHVPGVGITSPTVKPKKEEEEEEEHWAEEKGQDRKGGCQPPFLSPHT